VTLADLVLFLGIVSPVVALTVAVSVMVVPAAALT
jgi:hypothetical protein